MNDEQSTKSHLLDEIKAWKPADAGDPHKQRAAYVRLLELVRDLVDLELGPEEVEAFDGDPEGISVEYWAVGALSHLIAVLKRLDQGIRDPILKKRGSVPGTPLAFDEMGRRWALKAAFKARRAMEPDQSAEVIYREIAREFGFARWEEVRDLFRNMRTWKNYD